MQEQHAFPFLREILLFLTLAGILIPTLQRLRINQVLGFLAAGALFGPFGLGLLSSDIAWLAYLSFPRAEGVMALGELGILFLMFMIGLELSGARLWSLRRWVFGAGIAQVGVSAVLIGAAVLAMGQRMETAIILGCVLSLSSTAVVMQLMNERGSAGTPLGLATFSVLMLQDLAVVPLLILIGVMASQSGSDGLGMLVLLTMLKVGLAIALIYLVGGRVVHPLFRRFAHHRQPDVFMALVLLSALGIGAISAAAGLSMALGALIAGLLLAETEFKHEVELMVEPFKGLLMGLFFMTVGMAIDLRQVAAYPLLLAGAVLGLVAIKALVLTVVLRIGGLDWGRAFEGGLLLGQGGEFAFIVIGYATAGKLVDPGLGQQTMLAVGLSLFITPLLARLGRAVGERSQRAADAAIAASGPEPDAVSGDVVIAGFGRVGQQLAKLLTAQGIGYVAFENNARLVASQRALGVPVYFGDASRADLLHRVGAGSALAIVLTMDHPQSSLHAVRGIRRELPNARLFVRARDEQQARLLLQAGASFVVPETLEASLQLSAFVLRATGLDDDRVDRIVEDERALVSRGL